MNYDENTLDSLEKFIDDYLAQKKAQYKDSGDISIIQKLEHIDRTAKIAKLITNNNKMAVVAAKFHDIGRIPQYEILGAFRDDIILHHNLGEDFITRLLFKGILQPSPELDAIRQGAMYHGRTSFIPFKESPITKEAMEITEIISEVDDLDNGCIGALFYIEDEIVNDKKGYKAKNPDLDMKSVSPRVMEFYRRGEKFNKMTECYTYADYLLFAAILAIQSLKGKHKEIANQLMSWKLTDEIGNALEGYKKLFDKYIDPAFSKEAYEILERYYTEAKQKEETQEK